MEITNCFMNKKETGRAGKHYVGNCVIYARELQAKGGISIAEQMHDCLWFADIHGHRIVRTFKNTTLESLYGYCFDPGNKIDAVIIARDECLSRNYEYRQSVGVQFARIGITLRLGYSGNGIGV